MEIEIIAHRPIAFVPLRQPFICPRLLIVAQGIKVSRESPRPDNPNFSCSDSLPVTADLLAFTVIILPLQRLGEIFLGAFRLAMTLNIEATVTGIYASSSP